MESTVLFGLVYVAIAARAAVLVRSAASRLFRLYPFFLLLVIASMVRAGVSVLAVRRYPVFYGQTLLPVTILEAAAVCEAFWILASHFRRMKWFGWALIGLIFTVSAAAAGAVAMLRANWRDPLSAVVLFGMSTHIALLLSALLSLAFFRQFRTIPIKSNALRHILWLSILFGTLFLGNFMAQVTRGSWGLPANVLINVGTIAACAGWAGTMTREGENLPFDPPSEMSAKDFDAEESRHRKLRDELKRASGEAVRKLQA
jgi:hypothetical protein